MKSVPHLKKRASADLAMRLSALVCLAGAARALHVVGTQAAARPALRRVTPRSCIRLTEGSSLRIKQE